MNEVKQFYNGKGLYLEDETFDDVRSSFNTVLQKLFKSMFEANSDEGSITLKVDVYIRNETIQNNDPDIIGETRDIRIPSFDHKATSTVSIKDEMKGSKNPNMELVWDEETKMYKLQYVANTEQKTIFDKDIQESMRRSNNVSNHKALPESRNSLSDIFGEDE